MPPAILLRANHRVRFNLKETASFFVAEREFQSFKCVNSQLHLFLDVISARRQVSSPFIWFRNHNDVISIKMHSCVSRNQP